MVTSVGGKREGHARWLHASHPIGSLNNLIQGSLRSLLKMVKHVHGHPGDQLTPRRLFPFGFLSLLGLSGQLRGKLQDLGMYDWRLLGG